MRIFRGIPALAMALSLSPVVAGDLYLDINGLSRHYSSHTPRADLRETNTGLGLTYRYTGRNLLLSAGAYRDSYDGQAWYVGGGQRWRLFEQAGIGLEAGYLAGVTYRRWSVSGDRRLTPGAIPTLTLSAGSLSATVSALPPIGGLIRDPAVFASISIKIN